MGHHLLLLLRLFCLQEAFTTSTQCPSSGLSCKLGHHQGLTINCSSRLNLFNTDFDGDCELAIVAVSRLARTDILMLGTLAMATSDLAPFPLTPIDNTMPRHHVATLLFFPESQGSDLSAITETLQSGFAETLKAIPLLSGTVQVIDKDVQRGSLYIAAPWNIISDVFRVRDLRRVISLNYAELRDKNFPVQALYRKLFTPLADIDPQAPQKPVMLIQMNIIHGGIIIALCMHHSFTDGNGTVAVARIWAAFCRRENGSQLVTREMIERERLMRGDSVLATIEGFPQLVLLPEKAQSQKSGFCGDNISKAKDGPAPGHAIQSGLFVFSRTKLAELKSMASKKERDENGGGWISTNDAICSLLGCCVHSASTLDAEDHKKQAIIGLAVNMRKILDPPLPSDFIGNALNRLQVTIPRKTIEPTSVKVAEIAYLIRQKIKLVDQENYRRIISFLKSLPDISRVDMSLPKSQDVLGITSWTKQNFYDLDWGNVIGTKIERVRACMAATIKDFAIILPELNISKDQCGLEVLIWLEETQMERLKQDQLFNRFAEYVS